MILYALGGFGLIIAASLVRGTKDRFQDFCIGASLPLFLVLLGPVSWITTWLCPVTLDRVLRQADLALGLDGFAVTRWMIQNGWQGHFATPLYALLPFAMASAWLVSGSRTLLKGIVLGAVLAVPFYLLVPAVGPVYAFDGFPMDTTWVVVGIGTHPRNCFPSMHFCWALLLALNVKEKYWRWVFGIYAAAMAVVPVAVGEHYFVDILAAIPFTLLVQDLAERIPNLNWRKRNENEHQLTLSRPAVG